METLNVAQFREKYNSLVKIVQEKFQEEKNKIESFIKDDDQFYIDLGKEMSKTINDKRKGKDYLLENNPKLFTVSKEGVFVNIVGNINFKKILEGVDEPTAKNIWHHIVLLYVLQQIPENRF